MNRHHVLVLLQYSQDILLLTAVAFAGLLFLEGFFWLLLKRRWSLVEPQAQAVAGLLAVARPCGRPTAADPGFPPARRLVDAAFFLLAAGPLAGFQKGF